MKKYFLLFAMISLIFTRSAMAVEEMEHGKSTEDGEFTYIAMAGDIHTDFKIMELASMNMIDPDGKTHHVMAIFTRDGKQLTEIVGKVKIISPSKKEQIASFQNYGGGVYAANFIIDEPGNWGVICLFKNGDEKQTVKFWYEHMAK